MQALARPLKWPPIFPLEKGLVLWLPFDDRSGSRALDRSGKLNHGTLYGPTWAAGRRGSVLSFDGVDDYVNVASASSLNLADVSLCVWLKYVTNAAYNTIFNKRAQQAQYGFWWSYIYPNGTSIYWQYANGTTYVALGWVFDFTDGGWHHVVFTKQGDTVTAFIDGVNKGSLTASGALNESGNTLYVGRYQEAAHPFNGLIGEVRIYNRALNAAEIKRLYESELMLTRH